MNYRGYTRYVEAQCCLRTDQASKRNQRAVTESQYSLLPPPPCCIKPFPADAYQQRLFHSGEERKTWHENDCPTLWKHELKTFISYASASTTIDDDGGVPKQTTEVIFLQGDKEFLGNRNTTCILCSSWVITKNKLDYVDEFPCNAVFCK